MSEVRNLTVDKVNAFGLPKLASSEIRMLGGQYNYSNGFFPNMETHFNVVTQPSASDIIWRSSKLGSVTEFYKSGYFEASLSEALKVLYEYPEDTEALLRAGDAYYQLRKYDEALICYKDVSMAHPDDEEVEKKLVMAKERFQELNGLVDLARLKAESASDPTQKLDCSDYHGLLEIVDISGKGTGVILKQNVSKGSLICISKAFVANLNPWRFTSNDDLVETLAREVADQVNKNPTIFGPSVDNLPSNPEINKKPISYIDRLKNIIGQNRFVICNNEPSEYDRKWCKQSNRVGLFILPSHINRSCFPNVYYKFFNDVMLIYATIDLNNGDEILIPYEPPTFTLDVRNWWKAMK